MNLQMSWTRLFPLLAIAAMACNSKSADAPVGDGGAVKADAGSTPQSDGGADTGAAATEKRCLPDGGFNDNACDSCENAACCATRFACYDTMSCASSNMAFDDCMTAAMGDGGLADAGTAIAKCWADFSASGAAAKARVDCQRSNCKAECEVP